MYTLLRGTRLAGTRKGSSPEIVLPDQRGAGQQREKGTTNCLLVAGVFTKLRGGQGVTHEKLVKVSFRCTSSREGWG